MSYFPVKFGIIGCGAHAERRYLPLLSRDGTFTTLTAIHRRRKERLLELQHKWKIPRVYTSPEALVNDPEVDVVIVSSPPGLHKEHVCLAARAKRDVLVEKPFAANLNDAQEMMDCSEREVVSLYVGFSMRHCRVIQKIYRMLERGVIGRLRHIESCFTLFASRANRSWLSDPRVAGGGAVADLGSHLLDLMHYFHPYPVKQVNAILQPPFSARQIERQATVNLEFEKGVTAQLFVSFRLPRHKSLTLYGSRGKIYVENFSEINQEVIIFLTRKGVTETIPVKNDNHFSTMLFTIAMVHCDEMDAQAMSWDGVFNQELIERIYRGGM